MRLIAYILLPLFFVRPAFAQQAQVSEPYSAPLVIRAADPTDEMNAEVQIKVKARIAFEHENYADLNKQAESYRSSGEKTPSGYEKLAFFYEGISEFVSYQTPSLTGRPNVHQWELMLKRASDWMATAPSPAATVASAMMRQDFGWAWRGDDYAGAVKSADWKPYKKNVKLARQILESDRHASIDPQWYTEMVRVAMSQQWTPEQTAALYKEAFSRHPYYYNTYAAAMIAMEPEWSGSPEAMGSLIDFAVTNTKAKEGSSFYARLFQAVNCGCDHPDFVPSWQKLKLSFDDLVDRYPSQWNYNRYARTACEQHDKRVAHAVFAKLATPYAQAWYGRNELYESCKKWAEDRGDKSNTGKTVGLTPP